MKKYIFNVLAACAVVAGFASCSAEEGTVPGDCYTPSVRIYQYEPGANYNKDNDVRLRFATNGTTENLYYIMETVADKAANLAKLGEAAYMKNVVEKGTKVQGIDGASNVDVVLTGIIGKYAITAVAEGSNGMSMHETVFSGLKWDAIEAVTYWSNFKFKYTDFGPYSFKAAAAKLDDETAPATYKLISPYEEGYDLIVVVKNGAATVAKQAIASDWKGYGTVSVEGSGAYDASGNHYAIALKFTVSAGTIGTMNEYVSLPE